MDCGGLHVDLCTRPQQSLSDSSYKIVNIFGFKAGTPDTLQQYLQTSLSIAVCVKDSALLRWTPTVLPTRWLLTCGDERGGAERSWQPIRRVFPVNTFEDRLSSPYKC